MSSCHRLRRTLVPAAAAFLALVGLQTAARAHFVWATVENGQVRFALLEDASSAPSPQFEKYVATLTPTGAGGKALTLGAAKDGARYAALPAGQGVAVAESVVGPKERDGESYLLVYNVKGAATLDAAATLTKAPAEVLARREGNELVVSIRQEGWPVPQSEAWVQFPGEANPSSVQTDVRGDARVPWPATAQGGFVGVRALVKEAKPGESGGKKYNAVHRWATLTFPVQGAAPAAPAPHGAAAGDKPLTRVLREAFGKNHEVVGNAAFNQTLFEGKLTRAQLEVHLQQRALIHNECHRTLNAAGKNVPYGEAQKNVLVLLFQDLIAMGSGWPTEAQARPLTQSFLRQLRESEAKGPYFALGVQHVYYGGITNGGRMIGQKIGETVGVTPAYYAKSDGYPEYLVEVNKIADPAARAEVLRGGLAAYEYIIASSNEDVFKAPGAASPRVATGGAGK